MTLSLGDFAAEALDWPIVRSLFERHAFSSLGRRALEELHPRTEQNARAAIARAAELVGQAAAPPLAGITDPAPILYAAASFSRAFSEDEFRILCVFLRAVGKLRRWYSVHANQFPANALLCESIPDMAELSTTLDASLDERGRVLDDATQTLAKLRKAIGKLESEIAGVMRRIASSSALRTAQADGGKGRIHLRNGRPCLAMKARERRKLRGIVHDRSQSGETMFIEPEDVIEPGNRLVALKSDEAREVGRILTELTFLVFDAEPKLQASIAGAAELELALISVAYCERMGARMIDDDLNGGQPGMQLLEGRHPLLVEKQQTGEIESCVPIDLRLGDDFDLIVITGPNTGGKTLALKTAGLAGLMVRMGLPVIAAKGSRVPFYERIFCDIGDEQEVEQNLSTFSAHLARVRDALGDGETSGATSKSLVLMDELGGGTDPDEGAALGEALLEELASRRAPALVSTHIGRLKEVAYRLPRAENACCEFDLETLAPSYRLILGMPGESRALAIARRLGLPSDLIERAEALLKSAKGESGGSQRDALFQDLTTARRDIERLRSDAENRLREVEQERAGLEAVRASAAAEQKLLVREAQTNLESRLRDGKAKLIEARGILPRLSKAQAVELKISLDALEETLTSATLDETRREFLSGLKKGDHVWVPRYRRKCPITRIFKDKSRVRVRFGNQEMEIGFEEISTYDTI